MIKWIKRLALIAFGFSILPMLVAFDKLPLEAKLVAALISGAVLANIVNAAIVNVTVRILASKVGKRASLEALAEGIAKLGKTNAT